MSEYSYQSIGSGKYGLYKDRLLVLEGGEDEIKKEYLRVIREKQRAKLSEESSKEVLVSPVLPTHNIYKREFKIVLSKEDETYFVTDRENRILETGFADQKSARYFVDNMISMREGKGGAPGDFFDAKTRLATEEELASLESEAEEQDKPLVADPTVYSIGAYFYRQWINPHTGKLSYQIAYNKDFQNLVGLARTHDEIVAIVQEKEKRTKMTGIRPSEIQREYDHDKGQLYEDKVWVKSYPKSQTYKLEDVDGLSVTPAINRENAFNTLILALDRGIRVREAYRIVKSGAGPAGLYGISGRRGLESSLPYRTEPYDPEGFLIDKETGMLSLEAGPGGLSASEKAVTLSELFKQK